MPKRKQRKPKTRKRQSEPAKDDNTRNGPNIDSVRASTTRLILINLIIVWLAIASYAYTERSINAYELLSPTPKLIVSYLLWLLSIVGIAQSFMIGAILLLNQGGSKVENLGASDLKIVRNFYRSEIAVSIITLTVTVIPPLYISGFTDKIAELLNSYFPNLGEKISAWVSYLVTIIVSGVIGNFAYDILKRLVAKLFVGHKEQK